MADNFRFRQRSVHLTFPTHISHDVVLTMLQSKSPGKPLLWWSIVHEMGHADGDGDNAYEHTHAAAAWSLQLNLRGSRCFDIGFGGANLHPNIQKINDRRHAIKLYEEYHRKAPILLTQSDTTPAAHCASYDGIRQAPNLLDACTALGIEPKTVSDVHLIRQDKPLLPDFEHDYSDSQWTLIAPEHFRVLYIWGASGTGKTQWACHLFSSPLLVSHVDTLREYDPSRHDGIVFDDMSFTTGFTTEDLIAICDWDLPRTVRCRYSNAIIPRHTRKIFTSNKTIWENFPVDPAGAISRRITKTIHVVGPTFVPPAPVDVAPIWPRIEDAALDIENFEDMDFDLSQFV